MNTCLTLFSIITQLSESSSHLCDTGERCAALYLEQKGLVKSAWVLFPQPVGGENSLHKTEMSIYQSQDTEVATGMPLWQLPREKMAFPTSAFCTHIECNFPITHLANRKESQTGFDLWLKTAPIPLCSDKWPTSKSGSLCNTERGRTGSAGNN